MHFLQSFPALVCIFYNTSDPNGNLLTETDGKVIATFVRQQI